MKKLVLYIIIISAFVSCNHPKKATIQEINSAKKAANTLLENWHLAATNANYENYFSPMDSLSIYIGTDASENWSKSEFQGYSKPYFDKGKAWSFKTLDRNIYINTSADFIWFDELLDTWMGICRGSGVLEKTQDTWKIKHYVLSITVPNDDINAVVLAKKENDSIFLRHRKEILK